MRIRRVSADVLTAEHVRTWSQLQRADTTVHSPFFRPEFTQHVAAVHPDIEVAILEENGEAVGFFPFHRSHGSIGEPVGGPLCDFQGVVACQGVAWDPEELVRGCELAAWHYHHLLTSQESFRHHDYGESPSLYMDLAGGFEAYRKERSRAGSQQIRKAERKSRKAAH